MGITRIKTGIQGLDKLIDGGFPTNSSILMVGPPGVGKTMFSQQFIYEGVKSKQPSMYISLDSSPQEIREMMDNMGWKVSAAKDLLKFIDAYSWRTGGSKEEFSLNNLGNINEMNIMISDVIKALGPATPKRSVLDSISTLLLYADPSLVVRFIPVIIAKAKESGFTQLLLLEEGVHDEKTINTLNAITDGMIQFKMEEDKRMLRIDRLKATKISREWVEFEITDSGIKVK